METENCRICNGTLTQKFVFKEMMFGLRDEFPYGECSNCGCIQILKVPADIEKYYPPYYVSFTQKVPALKRLPFLKRNVNSFRMKRKYKSSNDYIIDYLRPIQIKPSAKILDIGCGKGALICSLYNLGFENIAGVDKFIANEIDHGNGVRVYKKDLSELKSNTYSLLMMHHVLEHMDEQVNELKQCYRLLKKGGVLLIRIPVIGTAWEIYKEDWVQLDAPRHFVLHTLKSIATLAEKAGFTLNKTVFDSTGFQFWGSELYKKNIPLTLPATHEWYPVDKGFTPEQIKHYEVEAEALNVSHTGDSARFYFYKN